MKKRYCSVVYRLAAICLALAMTFPVIAYATEPTVVSRETVQNFKENPQLSVQSAKTKLKLNKSSATILVGEKITLKATVTGKKGTVKWSSSKKSVATVSSKGVVTGKKKGTATITAKVNGVKKTCKVTVKSIPNVTYDVLNLNALKAANKLGIPIFHGAAHRKKVFITRIKVSGSNEKKKGMWELFVMDKSVSFFGCKVGMTKKQVSTALSKGKWKKTKTEKETSWDGYTNVYYKPTNTKSYAYKNKGVLNVRFDDKGKIWMMHYYID